MLSRSASRAWRSSPSTNVTMVNPNRTSRRKHGGGRPLAFGSEAFRRRPASSSINENFAKLSHPALRDSICGSVSRGRRLRRTRRYVSAICYRLLTLAEPRSRTGHSAIPSDSVRPANSLSRFHRSHRTRSVDRNRPFQRTGFA